jgi:hypothetical protein
VNPSQIPKRRSGDRARPGRGQLARYTGETGHLRARLEADSGQAAMLWMEIRKLREKMEAAIVWRQADELPCSIPPRTPPATCSQRS